MSCKPQIFTGAEGAVGLQRWFEKAESAFELCNCSEEEKVKFAAGTLENDALHWWRERIDALGLTAANAISWDNFKELMREEYCSRNEIRKLENEYYNLKMVGSDINSYTTRSHELAIMCPGMSNPLSRRIELYIGGLVPQIQGMVTSANPVTMQQAIQLARRLTDQAIEQGILPPKGSSASVIATHDNKRKWDNNSERFTKNNNDQQKRPNNNPGNNVNQGRRAYAGNLPECTECGFHHRGQCGEDRCQRCNRYGHTAPDCRTHLPKEFNPRQWQPNQQHQGRPNNKHNPKDYLNRNRGRNRKNVKGCLQCGKAGHFKKDCPQSNRNH